MMYLLNVFFVLTFVVLASANPHQRPEPLEETDADLFRKFIECARIAIVTGIPEIGLQSYDPFVISYDFRQEANIPSILTGYIHIGNMMMKDIPNWEVRQFDELSANDDGTETFNYTIYWRYMIFTADYKIDLIFYGAHFDYEGAITFELDHLNFFGVFNFTKAGSTRTQTINDLDLHVSTEEVQFNITGLGDISDTVYNTAVKELASEINARDYADISEALKNKLINDWILKQERIDAIVANCQK